jgi:hypothetical protein
MVLRFLVTSLLYLGGIPGSCHFPGRSVKYEGFRESVDSLTLTYVHIQNIGRIYA